MRAWKKYPKYKDSGVEWLGEIPESWKSVAIRHISIVKRGASPRPIDDPKYFDDNGEYAWVRISDVSASSRYLEQTTQKLSDIGQKFSVCLEPGEIFLSMAGSIGKVIITKIKCCIHDGFVYFVNLKENRDFLYYIFQCNQMYIGLGKLGTQLNLNTDTIGDIKISLPPLPEQTAIASFLDRETNSIDALIEKKQRQIELLQEKRAALISQAVTKGLDPTVPMRDSKVPWLGEVPEHWDVIKLKYVASLHSGHTPSRQHPEYWENCTIPWISLADVGQVRNGRLEYISKTKEKISELGLKNSAAELLPKNTVILSRTASVGYSAIMKYDMATTQDYANWICGSRILPIYLLFVFRSMKELFNSLMMGSTHNTIYMPDLIEFITPLPPLNEQSLIISNIQSKKENSEKLEDSILSSMEILKEYRSVLISAAVTGKIDVREENIV